MTTIDGVASARPSASHAAHGSDQADVGSHSQGGHPVRGKVAAFHPAVLRVWRGSLPSSSIGRARTVSVVW